MATLLHTFGYSNVYSLPDDNHGGVKSIFWRGGADIDADGSPHAYNPQNTGLDINADATSDELSVIQGADDPATGYYRSLTSLQIPGSEEKQQGQINAESVPFFVLPGGQYSGWGAKLGDVGLVYNSKTGDNTFAIFADVGPSSKIGEISIACAAQLSIPTSPRYGGVSSGVYYVVFPGSTLPMIKDYIMQPGDNWQQTNLQKDLLHYAFSIATKWSSGPGNTGILGTLKSVISQLS